MALAGTAQMAGQDWEGEEELLLDRLRRLEANRSGLYAVQIHLSKLRANHRQPTFLRIAARALETLAGSFDVTFYRITNADFILICRDVPIEEVDQTVYKIRALFSEDPATQGDPGSLDDAFTSWYDLANEGDFDSLLAEAEHLQAEAVEIEKRQAEVKRLSRAQAGQPLDPRNLADINRKLMETKIVDLIRQQPAVIIHPGGQGDVLFVENFVSMADLGKRVADGIDLFSSTWLFQYLTESLDRRMLMIAAKRDFENLRHAMSLNLNISTVMGQDFQRFHQAVGANAHRVVVEFQLIDVFSDMGAYAYVRDMLREHGYRVVLDGLNPLSLQFFDPGVLKADMMKINWGPEFLGEEHEGSLRELKEILGRVGANRVILGRVDSDKAVRWGLSLGIQRFQGRYADKVAAALAAKGRI
jgi:EAL domain-containing protein (putative c-di-GMP-specific phosphodiesterase class I)